MLTRVGKDGTGSQFVVDGFDAPNYIGVTSSHLYVSDRAQVFVVDR